jgi:anti-sigma factor RsiW
MPEFQSTNFDDELLSAYLDDELAPEERARVEERLAVDPQARQLLDELRSVSQAMKDLPPANLGIDLREAVLRRAERAMLVSDQPSSPGGLNEVVRKIPFGKSLRAWAWAGAALAAGILIMVFTVEPGNDEDRPLVAKRELRDESPRLELRSAGEPQQPVASGGVESAAPPRAEAPPPVPMNAPSSSAVVEMDRSFGAGGFGGAAAGRSGSAVDENGSENLLVVHVNVRLEALREKTIDAVLARNRIEIEEPANGAPGGDMPQDVDVVLVEASPAQVVSSLAEINADRTNFLAIAVDDELAESQRALSNELPAANLKQYNRGAVPKQQKLLVAPNNNFYYPTERGQIEIDRRMNVERYAQSAAAGKDDSQFDQRGRAIRVAPPSATRSFAAEGHTDSEFKAEAEIAPQPAAGEGIQKLGKMNSIITRRAEENLAAKADMLQVLFVLTADQEPASSPVPADSPE